MSDEEEEYSDYDAEEDEKGDEYEESSSEEEEDEEESDINAIKFENIGDTELPLVRRYIEKKELNTRMTMSIWEYAQLVGAMAQVIAETGKCEIDNAQGLSPQESAKQHIAQKKAWFYIRRIVKVISQEVMEVEIIHANDLSLPLNVD